jgi:multisubunit Na+/H+ antiporter MnhB subunit
LSAALAFDVLLCAVVIAVAISAVWIRTLFAAVVVFLVFGLLLSVVWVRLGAVDVALAEAAIGAGATGVLLLRVTALLRNAGAETGGGLPLRLDLLLLSAGVTAGLVWAVIHLSAGSASQFELVEAQMAASGVGHRVTAVLLNFRGYDTLLESVVLLAAMIAVWSLTPDPLWGGRPGIRQHVRPDGVLAHFGRVLPPVGVLVGVYLVWRGSDAPGGAFQGGTILAAVWMLALMAGAMKPPKVTDLKLRLALCVGPAVFVVVAAATALTGGLLTYPPELAKPLILLIEAALALSIAATVGLLVTGEPRARS